MNTFMNEMNKSANYGLTQNGGLAHKSTGEALYDMFAHAGAMRNRSDEDCILLFKNAFDENPVYALKCLFYERDVRGGGQGERRYFRVCYRWLIGYNKDAAKRNLEYIPEYGRWDDLLYITEDTKLWNDAMKIVKHQLALDMECKAPSLAAKWLPSINASNAHTITLAHKVRSYLGMTPRQYRKTLSDLRRYIDVVERKMSNQDWEEIDYETVPSKANLLYNNAFLRHDEDRRRLFLNAVKKGEAKINAGTLFPHEIVHKYKTWGIDETLEALWKNLPDTVQGAENVMVVADGSASMTRRVGNTSIQALEVANALAIYFAERSSGQFKDKYITFSMTPQYVDISQETLRQKLNEALIHNECTNTNIEAVFDMILKTAVDNSLSQGDLPGTILIISDGEFDGSVSGNPVSPSRYYWNYTAPTTTLFDTIRAKYEAHGYQLPKLTFWNVCSRTNTIPVKENNLGVALVSGFSVNTIKMVLSNKLDPWEILKETLMDHRYDFVTNVMTEYQNKVR